MKRVFIALLLVISAVLTISIARAQNTRQLTVFAAASLTDAYESIADAFEAENPNVEVLYNFGGSSTLATQLVQGAPADIFASANDAQMQVAIDGGRIASEPVTFARNRLVLIVPSGNPADIGSLRDLANPNIHLILAAPDVPVRTYTDTMLERMANDPDYGDDFRNAVLANLVSEEPNVRQVSAKVALGEADAGIVYLSDVTPDIADEVIALPIADAFNTIASYPIAITDDTDQPELAQAFIDFVLSDAGQDILASWNFVSVRGAEHTLLVDGLVQNPLSLTADTLRADFTPQTVRFINIVSEDEPSFTTFTGALLWDVITAAQPNLDVGNSSYLVITSTEGYQTVIAFGELDPIYGNQIIIAYQINDEPNAGGSLHLIHPSAGGRSLFDVVNISLRDAPVPDGG